MTKFVPWIPPPGAVVEPPVHPETLVTAIYSDGLVSQYDVAAEAINWSAEGDGPTVVAYAIVDEYKPAPKVAREWWITMYDGMAWDWEWQAIKQNATFPNDGNDIIHVREVLQGREVVAWAVVDAKGSPTIFYGEDNAMNWQREEGGTVRPLGFLP